MKSIVSKALVFGWCLFMLFSGISLAQTYPTKPIVFIINSAPGQLGDVTTRAVAGKAEKLLGQPFDFVNNNAGGGAVAFSMVKKAKPDGYTIMSTATGNLIWLPFTRHVDYKLEDFTPITQNLLMESGVVVKADAPWKTFKEFVAYAKQNPGKVSYAITSAGVPMDIAMQYVAKQEGIRWTAVPTPGSDPNTMLLGGHVTAYSGSTSWLPHVKTGAFRLLAVHSSKRMKEFPDVPTFKELGYDFVHESQSVFLAPKGTPEALIKKLDDAFHKALDDKDVIDLYTKLGVQVSYRDHKELSKYLYENLDIVGRAMKTVGITPEAEKR
ncbi:MAG TPA: tripartite tricarboxylate transporter substrate binding protein [Syntrophorhabdaceae bacterium]|nr:tripartite tricarboxylate transporter substrate binding protein [Syntrophorhabdaceae bacterium]